MTITSREHNKKTCTLVKPEGYKMYRTEHFPECITILTQIVYNMMKPF